MILRASIQAGGTIDATPESCRAELPAILASALREAYEAGRREANELMPPMAPGWLGMPNVEQAWFRAKEREPSPEHIVPALSTTMGT